MRNLTSSQKKLITKAMDDGRWTVCGSMGGNFCEANPDVEEKLMEINDSEMLQSNANRYARDYRMNMKHEVDYHDTLYFKSTREINAWRLKNAEGEINGLKAWIALTEKHEEESMMMKRTVVGRLKNAEEETEELKAWIDLTDDGCGGIFE